MCKNKLHEMTIDNMKRVVFIGKTGNHLVTYRCRACIKEKWYRKKVRDCTQEKNK